MEALLLRLTLLPVAEIGALMDEQRATPERRVAQRVLARQLTELVHGPAATDAAEAAAEVLFGGDPTTASPEVLETVEAEVPSSAGEPGDLGDAAGLVALLVRTGLASSNGDARRTLAQGGVSANGRRVAADGAGRAVRAAPREVPPAAQGPLDVPSRGISRRLS